ncbi:hypothetical protein EDE11_1013 [Methylomonas methanica]|uniref:Uncharacterized protein n=1 Tax=Methylomonas methanica TaxID=421 RepID=A0ABY2CSN1_METMH|nr:hypothetical protein EDE11_1013 [Methylomonas methanica]
MRGSLSPLPYFILLTPSLSSRRWSFFLYLMAMPVFRGNSYGSLNNKFIFPVGAFGTTKAGFAEEYSHGNSFG